jgi:hypothetical protein
MDNNQYINISIDQLINNIIKLPWVVQNFSFPSLGTLNSLCSFTGKMMMMMTMSGNKEGGAGATTVVV